LSLPTPDHGQNNCRQRTNDNGEAIIHGTTRFKGPKKAWLEEVGARGGNYCCDGKQKPQSCCENNYAPRD
jgi:hypothetical protein